MSLESAVAARMRTNLVGRHRVFRAEVDSTNSLAKELADQGAEHGTLVFAASQTAGRGRRGRTWLGIPGQQVFLSVIVRPNLPVTRVFELTLIAAVSLADTLQDLGVKPEIKWPNDLELGGRKVAGILCESAIDGSGNLRYAIIGVGANAEGAANVVPAEIADRATSLEAVTGRSGEASAIIAAFGQHLEKWLAVPTLEPVLRRWKACTTTLGQEVRLLIDGHQVEGIAEDIDEAGALLVRQGAKLHRILAGEITSLRPVRPDSRHPLPGSGPR